MSDMFHHRKAVVSSIIRGARGLWDDYLDPSVRLALPSDELIQKEDKEHGTPGDICIATGLFFPHDRQNDSRSLGAKCTTWSNYGPLWMGLWLDCPLILHDGENNISHDKLEAGYADHGNTLFPRWLAEGLNLQCDIVIIEEDIYENDVQLVKRYWST